jgi:hypothetical protein
MIKAELKYIAAVGAGMFVVIVILIWVYGG